MAELFPIITAPALSASVPIEVYNWIQDITYVANRLASPNVIQQRALAANSVGTNQIIPGAVGTNELGSQAVQNTNLGLLAVDTPNINNHAVTNVSAISANVGTGVANGTLTTVMSLIFTSTGGKLIIDGTMTDILLTSAAPSTPLGVFVRLHIDGGGPYAYSNSIRPANYPYYSTSFLRSVTTLSAGVHTIEIKAVAFEDNVLAYDRSITVTELKK